jgi:DNA-binding winged helix-turn-helix (wHTH) protein
MDKGIFRINDRFEIDPALGSIRDLANGKESRPEPRLMQLLSILYAHKGRLVTRELLAKEIWNDYPGADDGLNQSISALRKLLGDHDKTVIETIPKKGYLLNAEVPAITGETLTAGKKRKARMPLIVSISTLVILAIAWALFLRSGDEPVKKNTAVPFRTIDKPAEETYYNTVTSISPDNTEYKLVNKGDARPDFYINKHLATPAEMEAHVDLIRGMEKELWKRKEQRR